MLQKTEQPEKAPDKVEIIKKEIPQKKLIKPKAPQKPSGTDEDNIPQSDYKVPEIG